VFNINLSFSQNAFYEAQFLSNLDSEELKEMVASGDQIKQQLVSFNNSEKNEIKNLVSFLKDPFSDDVSSINFAIVQVIINKYNQYIVDRREFSKGPVGAAKHFLPTAGASMALSFIPNLISGNTSLSDTAQSNIIDGLTKYYAEEFKKAQTISYMKAFEATAGKIGELQIIFPESYYKLKNADPSKFPDLGNEYKKIFNEDLKNAWPNLLSYIENYPDNAINDQYLSLLKAKNLTTIRSHEAYFPIVISSDILSKLVENQHPVEVISFIDNKYYDPKKLGDDSNKSKIANTIHGIEILQSNLRDTSKVIGNNFSNVWIGAEQLKQLNTENEIKYFLGLIYQQDRDYFNYLFSQIGIDKSKIEELKYFIDKKVRPLITYFNTIQEVGKSYKKSEDYEVLVKYLEANIELYLSLELIYEDDNLTKYFQTSKNLVYIYGSVKKTDYSNATYYILNILNEFLGDDQAYQNVIFKIDEYGGFMAEIVNAENSDAVKETITKFAAPPSSFILKRTYRHTFSITGQPGYFASYERLKEQKDWKFVSGITLPIGFEYSYKTKKDFMNTRGSIGLFVQLIDLGAVLNFRIDDSTSELPDQITFEQIFSPGGSINYGFKNSPLTIAVGYQYTPELRKITLENGTEKFTKGDRWFVRLAWDIPLINIGKSKSR
jgi:hypothetical protein